MEERYYTPDVSEFCVGFKFYAKQKQNDKSTSLAWIRDDNIYPWEITKDNYGEVFEYLHYGDLRESAVVKYLDKEDIESLGFEFNYSKGDHKTFSKFLSVFRDRNNKWLSITIQDSDWVYIEISDTKEVIDESLCFTGTIKN